MEDFDILYRLLRSQYKEFQEHHRSSHSTILELKGEIKRLCSHIE